MKRPIALIARPRLVLRLATRDLRTHPAEAVLLVAAITATTTTLALALAVHAAGQGPWERTWQATAGPHVVAMASPGAEAALAALASTPGVTASSGPFPQIFTRVESGGREVGVAVEGRDRAPAAVDQPLVTSGGWVRDGGVVVERSFAEALAVGVGDGVTADTQRVRTVLLTGSTLLALLALVSVAVLVGGRLANQTRRVGLLKAVGATPRLVAAVLLAEHLVLALVAAAIGVAAVCLRPRASPWPSRPWSPP